jgi:hypothetical protein
MAIDLFVPEFLFFTPRWEPSDCSVVKHEASGRLQMFCHFSQRLVALVDTYEEAEVLLIRSKMRNARNPGDFGGNEAKKEFMTNYFKGHIEWYLEELQRLGVEDYQLAPEIVGANRLVNESSAAATVKKALGDAAVVKIDLKTPSFVEMLSDGSVRPELPTNKELEDVISFLFSDMVVLDEGSADVQIAPNTVADLTLLFDEEVPVELTISRETPDYPGYIVD